MHRVQQGECLSTIAIRHGLSGWQALHDHPLNADLKKKRPNPDILYPGDEVFVPEREPKEVECATGKLHQFKVRPPKGIDVRVVLEDWDDLPYGDKRFVVLFGEQRIEGRTADDGLVHVQVSHEAPACLLQLWLEDDESKDPDLEYELDLGHLDPVDTLTGVQARLSNLGFDCPVDDRVSAQMLAAVRRFRRKYELPEGDGDPIDEALRSKLVELHDG